MNEQTVFEAIVESVRFVLPSLESTELSASDSLDALGANSVDRSEIVMMTLETLNLAIPLVETFGPKNLGELAQLLHVKLTNIG